MSHRFSNVGLRLPLLAPLLALPLLFAFGCKRAEAPFLFIDRLTEENVAASPLKTASGHVVAEPTRTRKLLLNRREIDQLIGAVEREGYTIVPLELYWSKGKVKLEIGVAKGKQAHDKRDTEKERDWQRDKGRLMRGKG